MSGSFSYDQYPLYRDYAVRCTQRKETNSLCVSGTQERIEEMYSTCQGSHLQESAVATAVERLRNERPLWPWKGAEP
jgi:hypothetical protein